MKIIVGHTNMDIDCIASVALARKLYPDHVAVKSGRIHPAAKHIYNLYETHLDFVDQKELDGEPIESIIVVDTRNTARVREYERLFAPERRAPTGPLVVYDHHPESSDDLEATETHYREVGANATNLGIELIERGVSVTPEEATVALAGIYADTGNFTHDNTTPHDLAVAAWLVEGGAEIATVTSLIRSLRNDGEIGLLHEALNQLSIRGLKGHDFASFTITLDRQSPGLAAIVEKVLEIERLDAVVGIFEFSEERATLVVARSAGERFDVHRALEHFGGGGHRTAASAVIRDRSAADLLGELERALEETVEPAITAGAIMTTPVHTIGESFTLLEASLFLEGVNHTGVPVMAGGGELTGFLTLRDIMKGRKSNMMHAPVKGFMSHRVVSCAPDAPMHEMERLFFEHNIGHLPVVDEGRLVGIVTRSDYLAHLRLK